MSKKTANILLLILFLFPCLLFPQVRGNNTPLEYTQYVMGYKLDGNTSYLLFLYNEENRLVILKKEGAKTTRYDFSITSPFEWNSFKFYKDNLFIHNSIRGGVFYGKIEDYIKRAGNELMPLGNDNKIHFLPNISQIEIVGEEIYCSEGNLHTIYKYSLAGNELQKGERINPDTGARKNNYINYFVPADIYRGNSAWNIWQNNIQGFQTVLSGSNPDYSRIESQISGILGVQNTDELIQNIVQKGPSLEEYFQELAVNIIESKKTFDDYITNAAMYNYKEINPFTPDSSSTRNINITTEINNHKRIEDAYNKKWADLVDELGSNKENDINRVIGRTSINLDMEQKLVNDYYLKLQDGLKNDTKEIFLRSGGELYSDCISLSDAKKKYDTEYNNIGEWVNKLKQNPVFNEKGTTLDINSKIDLRKERQSYGTCMNNYSGSNYAAYISNTARVKKSLFDTINNKPVTDMGDEYYVYMLQTVLRLYLIDIQGEYVAKNAVLNIQYESVKKSINDEISRNAQLQNYSDVLQNDKLDIDKIKAKQRLEKLFNELLDAGNNKKKGTSKAAMVKYAFKSVYDKVNIYYQNLKKPSPYQTVENYTPLIYFYNDNKDSVNRTYFTVVGMENFSTSSLFSDYRPIYIDFDDFRGYKTHFAPNTVLSPVLFDGSDTKIFSHIRMTEQRLITYRMDTGNWNKPVAQPVPGNYKALIPAERGVFALIDNQNGRYSLARIITEGNTPKPQALGGQFGTEDVVYIIRKNKQESSLTVDRNGKITVLFNNAGVAANCLPVQIGPDSFAEIGLSNSGFTINSINIR